MERERRVLRVGGAGGILGAVLILAGAFIILAYLPPIADTAEFLTQYGQRAATAVLVSGPGLAGLLISITFFLALCRSLKETNLEYALAGLLFYVVGVALVGASVGAFILFPRTAADYAAGNAAERTAIVAAMQATFGFLEQVEFVGSLFIALSVLSFGAVMLGNQRFGLAYGGLSLLFGVVGLAVVPLSLILPLSVVPNLLLIVYLLIFGWRVLGLSKGT